MNNGKKSRAEKLGIMLADSIMEVAHLTYNAPRGKKIVQTCINRLQERLGEIKPVPATPEYKKARYGDKDN